MASTYYAVFFPLSNPPFVNPESVSTEKDVDFFPGATAITGRNLFPLIEWTVGVSAPQDGTPPPAIDFGPVSLGRHADAIESVLLQFCAEVTRLKWVDILARVKVDDTTMVTTLGYRFGMSAVDDLLPNQGDDVSAVERLIAGYGTLTIGYRAETSLDTYGPPTFRGWDRVHNREI